MTEQRTLILSGGIGAGHVVAARAVEEELVRAGVVVEHLDAFAFMSRPARWAIRELHLGLMEFIPGLYGPLFDQGSRSRLLAQVQRQLAARSRARLARLIAAIRPQVVFATHGLGCQLAAPLKTEAGFRLAVLTTDYRAHAFHLHAKVDHYCASHAWAAEDLRAAGVPADRISVTGIPLRHQFDAVPSQADARRALGLPLDARVILVSRGGMATGRETVSLLRVLLAAPPLRQCHLVVIAGSRTRGYRLLSRRLTRDPRLRVERAVDSMATYLAASDLVVGKPGGLFSTEAFIVGRPLVIFAPNEGIETANVERFVAAGAALNAERSPTRVADLVAQLLADPARGTVLATAARSLVTPGSRQAVVRVLRELAAAYVPARASGRSE